MQASESMDIVDKLTAIDMKAAVSAGEIAEGLSRFANLGSLAGIDIDEAAAYVATIADVTQMGGDSAGQALKTIISRYGNVKAGAYGKMNVDTEATDDTNAINDVERVLKNLGISIRSSNLQFRDFSDVLSEIAQRWQTLDTVSKKAVATSFAGIRQQEAFVTLMENWDKNEELLAVSRNSRGTAEKKYTNAYQESLQAAYNRLTASLESIINRAEVNGLLEKLVDIGTTIVKYLPIAIRYLPNFFFSLQSFRALSGQSLLQRGINGAWRTLGLYGQPAEGQSGRSGRWWGLGRFLFGRGNPDFKRTMGQPLTEADLQKNPDLQTNSGATPTAPAAEPAQSPPSNGGDYRPDGQGGYVSPTGLWAPVNPSAPSTSSTGGNERAPAQPTGGGNNTNARAMMGGKVGQGALMVATIALNSIATAISAYQTSGKTHTRVNAKGEEVDVQSSEAARAAGRNITTSLAWIPVVGQMIGEHLAEGVMQQIDAERDMATQVTEKANEMLGTLQSIETELSTLGDSISSISIEDQQQRNAAVRTISEILYKQENADVRRALEKNLGGGSLLTVLNNIKSSNNEQREIAARRLRVAEADLKNQQTRLARAQDEYETKQAIGNQWLETRKYEEGYDPRTGLEIGKSYGNTSVGAGAGAAIGLGVVGLIAAAVSGGTLLPLVLAGLGAAGVGVGAWQAIDAQSTNTLLAQEAEKGQWASKPFYELKETIKKQIEQTQAEINALDSNTTSTDANSDSVDENTAYTKLQVYQKFLQELEDYEEKVRAQIAEDDEDRLGRMLISAQDTQSGLYLESMSQQEAEALGTSRILEALAKENERIAAEDAEQGRVGAAQKSVYGFSMYGADGKTLTEQAKKMLLQTANTDPELKAAISGKNITLERALKNLDKKDWADALKLQNFANIFGTTIDALAGNMDYYITQFGTMTQAELMKSTEDLIGVQTEYSTLLDSITDGTKSVTEWMNQIADKFPDLITYMGDTSKLMERILQKTHDITEFEFRKQWESIASSEEAWNARDWGNANGSPNSFSKQASDWITKHYSLGLSQQIGKLLDSRNVNNLQEAMNFLVSDGITEGTEAYEALSQALSVVGSDIELISDNYQQFMQKYIEYNTKLLQMEIDNLTKQRDTLKQINSQREYENRLVEAKLKLEDAMENKKRIYRAGVGFVYEPDQQAIAEAQKNLENVQVEKDVSAINKRLEILQAEKDDWSNIYEYKNWGLLEDFVNSFQNEYLNEFTTTGTIGRGFADVVANLKGEKAPLVQTTQSILAELQGRKEESLNKLKTTWGALRDFYAKNGTDTTKYNNGQIKEYNNLLAKYQAAYTDALNGKYIGDSDSDLWKLLGSSGSSALSIPSGDTKSTRVGSVQGGTASAGRVNAALLQTGGAVGTTTYQTSLKDEAFAATSAEQLLPTGHAPDEYTKTAWFPHGGKKITLDTDKAKFVLTMPERGSDTWTKQNTTVVQVVDLKTNDPQTGSLKATTLSSSSLSTVPNGIYCDLSGEQFYLVYDGQYAGISYAKGDKRPLGERAWVDFWSGITGLTNSTFFMDNLQVSKGWATGSTSVPGGLSRINELGTEAIVTPSGTITALPSHSGVIPADITKNLWELGEIAPSVLRAMDRINPSATIAGTTQSQSIDESFNIANLTMNVSADDSFDADAFVASIRSRVALTRNTHR